MSDYEKRYHTPLYKEVEIGGKKYFDHRVFGLQTDGWFNRHGITPDAEGVPMEWKTDKNGERVYVPTDKWYLAEGYTRKASGHGWNNPPQGWEKMQEEDQEALDSLVRDAKDIL